MFFLHDGEDAVYVEVVDSFLLYAEVQERALWKAMSALEAFSATQVITRYDNKCLCRKNC
jgi:hypothetical protein